MYANPNLEAIRSLKSSNPNLSLLSEFKGWGSLKDVFAEGNKDFHELKSLLTEEEYNLATRRCVPSPRITGRTIPQQPPVCN